MVCRVGCDSGKKVPGVFAGIERTMLNGNLSSDNNTNVLSWRKKLLKILEKKQ